MPEATRKPTPADSAGRDAQTPLAIPAAGWWAVLKRTWAEAGKDNIGLIAAGTAFYGFLAIVPMLGAVVLLYGLIADGETVIANIRSLFGVLPEDAARLIGEQLINVEKTSQGKKGLGLVIALGLALYGATKGASSFVIALNVAYEEEESRGFIKLNLLALAVTAGAVVLALAAIASVAALAFLDNLLEGAPALVLTAIRLGTYVVMAALGITGAAALYRYGPDRARPKWSWASPGSIVATLLWLAATLGFGLYASQFGNYNATYGSLGAVIVLLTWLWLSAYIFLLGAELNSELERQTAIDTTDGAPLPMGSREAVVADDVAGDAKPPRQDRAIGGGDEGEKPATGSGIGTTAIGIKVAARATGVRVGMPTALLAAAGLSALRRGAAGKGAGLIAAGAALAWLTRRAPDQDGADPGATPGDTSASIAA